MKQVFLAFALLLVHASVSKASPITDDNINLRFRYPVWWRPSEDMRSYWDPLIARLIWTHPVLRRYYKELAGWDSSNEENDRPNLLTILNEYEDHDEPLMLDAYREDDTGEKAVDEKHPAEDQEGEPTGERDAVSNSGDVKTSAESEHRENNAENGNSIENSEQNREYEGIINEGEIADRKRRSFASENQQLWRNLLRCADLRSRQGRQKPSIEAENFNELADIKTAESVQKNDLDSDPEVTDALLDLCVQVDSEGVGGLLGGVLGGDRSHTAAFGGPTAKRDAVSRIDGVVELVPAAKILDKENLDDADVNKMLDDLQKYMAYMYAVPTQTVRLDRRWTTKIREAHRWLAPRY